MPEAGAAGAFWIMVGAGRPKVMPPPRRLAASASMDEVMRAMPITRAARKFFIVFALLYEVSEIFLFGLCLPYAPHCIGARHFSLFAFVRNCNKCFRGCVTP
jgi:hypothetical protein